MKVLMCMPTHYKVSYEINPYMHIEKQPDLSLALSQWGKLVSTLSSRRVEIQLIVPLVNAPDMVFTANGGLQLPGLDFMPSMFQFKERSLEEIAYFECFKKPHSTLHMKGRRLGVERSDWDGTTTRMWSPPFPFEGEGDALLLQPSFEEGVDINTMPTAKYILLMGYGLRTDRRAIFEAQTSRRFRLNSVINTRVVPLSLQSPLFYHLDTCLFPYLTSMGRRKLLLVEGTLSPESLLSLCHVASPKDWVTIPPTEGLVCNSIQIGKDVLLNHGGGGDEAEAVYDYVTEMLQADGLNVVPIETSEFHKAGGGAKCMILWLER